MKEIVFLFFLKDKSLEAILRKFGVNIISVLNSKFKLNFLYSLDEFFNLEITGDEFFFLIEDEFFEENRHFFYHYKKIFNYCFIVFLSYFRYQEYKDLGIFNYLIIKDTESILLQQLYTVYRLEQARMKITSLNIEYKEFFNNSLEAYKRAIKYELSNIPNYLHVDFHIIHGKNFPNWLFHIKEDKKEKRTLIVYIEKLGDMTVDSIRELFFIYGRVRERGIDKVKEFVQGISKDEEFGFILIEVNNLLKYNISYYNISKDRVFRYNDTKGNYKYFLIDNFIGNNFQMLKYRKKIFLEKNIEKVIFSKTERVINNDTLFSLVIKITKKEKVFHSTINYNVYNRFYLSKLYRIIEVKDIEEVMKDLDNIDIKNKFSQKKYNNLKIVLMEVLKNSIYHGFEFNPNLMVYLLLLIRKNKVIFILEDISLRKFKFAKKKKELFSLGGRGLFLIEKLSDKIDEYKNVYLKIEFNFDKKK